MMFASGYISAERLIFKSGEGMLWRVFARAITFLRAHADVSFFLFVCVCASVRFVHSGNFSMSGVVCGVSIDFISDCLRC